MVRLIDADAVERITWEQPTYTDPLNVLTEARDRIKELPTADAVPTEEDPQFDTGAVDAGIGDDDLPF